MIVQGECRAKLVLAMQNRSQSWASPNERLKSGQAMEQRVERLNRRQTESHQVYLNGRGAKEEGEANYSDYPESRESKAKPSIRTLPK